MNLGWFTSGGKSSYLLFDKTNYYLKNNETDTSIEFVFCDKELGENEDSDKFIQYVQSLNIPIITLSWKNFKIKLKDHVIWAIRQIYFHKVRDLITKLLIKKNINIDYIFLIGFMLIVTSDIFDVWKTINLHPALPNGPTGTWKQVIKELLKDKPEFVVSGAMMHYVIKDLDKGKPLTYFKFSCAAEPETVRKFGFSGEYPLIIETIKYLKHENGFDVTEAIKKY